MIEFFGNRTKVFNDSGVRRLFFKLLVFRAHLHPCHAGNHGPFGLLRPGNIHWMRFFCTAFFEVAESSIINNQKKITRADKGSQLHPRKRNMEPEYATLEKDIPLQTVHYHLSWVPCLFSGVYLDSFDHQSLSDLPNPKNRSNHLPGTRGRKGSVSSLGLVFSFGVQRCRHRCMGLQSIGLWMKI